MNCTGAAGWSSTSPSSDLPSLLFAGNSLHSSLCDQWVPELSTLSESSVTEATSPLVSLCYLCSYNSAAIIIIIRD